MNKNFDTLSEDEQIAQMRNFLNSNYKLSNEIEDCKISHTFTIIYDYRHIDIILQFVNNTNSQKVTYVQINIEDNIIIDDNLLFVTIKDLKKLNYIKTKIKEMSNKIDEELVED